MLLLAMPAWSGVGLHRIFGHRMPPMALLVLAALARRHGWRVRIVDLNEENLPSERPDAVGITVWTMLAPQAYALADDFRARGIPVVLGGVHPSMMPTEALRHADAVVVGEAEAVFPTVLDDLAASRSQGVYLGEWLAMEHAPRAPEWLDLVRSWPLTRYVPLNTFQTTRGCRFNCDFCSVIRVNGRGSRHHTAEEAVQDLVALARHGQRLGKFRYTFLLDDDLAADREYTAAFCEAMLSAGVPTTWGAQASVGLAGDPELVDLAARSGCRVIFTGFESVSRETLLECNKKNRPSQFGESVRRLHDRGIMVEGAFIFGFDHDEPGVFEDTVAVADRIDLDAAHFSILTPYPGTHTFARMAEQGRILHYDWGRYDLYHAALEPAHMSPAALEEGLWRAYKSFYSGPRRRRRLRRHVAGRFHPVFTAAFFANNRDYARRYHASQDTGHASYTADPGDIELLLATSSAPAQQAIQVAFRQVNVAVGPSRHGAPTAPPPMRA